MRIFRRITPTRGAEVSSTIPLMPIIQLIFETRIDKYEWLSERIRFRRTLLVTSALLIGASILSGIAIGIAGSILGDFTLAVAGGFASVLCALLGAFIFTATCSASTFARGSRAIRLITRVFRYTGLAGAYSCAALGLVALSYGIILGSNEPRVVNQIYVQTGILAVIAAVPLAMLAATSTPPLIAADRRTSGAKELATSLRCWCFTLFAVVTGSMVIVSVAFEALVLPSAAVLALSTFTIIQSESRRRDLNSSVIAICDQLTDLHLEAEAFATGNEKRERRLLASLLKLQQLLADDPAPILLSVLPRVRTGYEYQVLFAYLICRIGGTAPSEAVERRERFFEGHLGFLEKKDLAVSIGEFAWDLRQQLLVPSLYRMSRSIPRSSSPRGRLA